MSDRRAQPRVRARREAVQPLHHQGIEMVVEPLHRHQVHRGPPLRVVGVERHAIAELVQSDGERGGRRALLLVHRLADRAGLGRRSRRRRAAGARRDRADGAGCRRRRASSGADPASVSTRASTAASMSMSSPCACRWQRSSPMPRRASGRRSRGHRARANGCSVLWRRLDLVHRAPVVPVAPAVNVPLRDTSCPRRRRHVPSSISDGARRGRR